MPRVTITYLLREVREIREIRKSKKRRAVPQIESIAPKSIAPHALRDSAKIHVPRRRRNHKFSLKMI
jgi:hypothetical protein